MRIIQLEGDERIILIKTCWDCPYSGVVPTKPPINGFTGINEGQTCKHTNFDIKGVPRKCPLKKVLG